jgi:hypothetical protein
MTRTYSKKGKIMRTIISGTLIAACIAFGTVPADAQILKATPRIGMYLPAADLGELDGESISMDNSLAVGLGLELALPLLPFNLRANLDYATGTSVASAREGLDSVDMTDATLLALAADAVFRLPRALVLQPYVFVGAGIKQYNFDTTAPDTFAEGSDPALHLGGGLDLGLSGLSITLELSDYLSRFELVDGSSELQHDLFLSLGLSLGLL